MRKSLQCPKCEGRKLWRIEEVGEHGHANAAVPFAVSMQKSFWTGKGVGRYETFICAGCGYTEWYAYELEALKHDPKKGVHFIDDEPESGLR